MTHMGNEMGHEAESPAGTVDRETSQPVASEAASVGSRLLRSFFGAWKALALRGTRDQGFKSALDELRRAVEELWAEGEPAQLVRYGRGLMIGHEAVAPRSLLRLQAEALADELATRDLGGISFHESWDNGEVTRFLQLLQGWRRGDAPEGKQGKEAKQAEMREQDISCVVLEEAITGEQVAEEQSGWNSVPELGATRQQAKKTFFRALRSARWHMRSMAGGSAPQTRRARAVVHEIVDTLMEEEFSILSMTALSDFDEHTFHHCVNVCILSTALGQRLGLNKRELSELGVAALFHDLGKMAVPEPVLNKPGKFDPEEWELMKSHPLEGVRNLLRFEKINDLTLKIMLASLEHHMRVDQTGYPRMDDTWQIGVLSRIVSIADCYDAMSTKRVYHEHTMHPHDVLKHMLSWSGKNFDPTLMRLFVNMMGLYPVGSLLRLSSGELAVAVASQENCPRAPLVRLVRHADGRDIDQLELLLVNLAEEQSSGNAEARSVAATVDPQEAGIDLSGYLL
jgi:HD-GYP domain-containing protein (c-di-GMP phosphodiesterase class II)